MTLPEVPRDALRDIYDDLVALVEGAPSMIPTAAFRIGQIPPRVLGSDDDIADHLLAVAEVPDAEHEFWKRKALKELRKGHDKLAFESVDPDLTITTFRLEDRAVAIAETKLATERANEILAEIAGEGAADFGPVNFDAMLAAGDIEPPKPSLGSTREDGVRLLYVGYNGIFGEPGKGKTQFANVNAADVLMGGGTVDWIDTDANGPQATYARLRSAGVPDDALRERFRLWTPANSAEFHVAVAAGIERTPDLEIIDSIGASMGLFGLDQLNDRDYTAFHSQQIAPIMAAGVAVLGLDHTMKTRPGDLYAGGTSAKKRVVDGAYYTIEMFKDEPFRPGALGKASIRLAKDRHGGTGYGEGDVVAVFVLDTRDADNGPWDWRFHPGRSRDERNADQDEGDVAYVLSLATFPTSIDSLQATLRARDDGKGKAWNRTRAADALRKAKQRRDGLTTFPLDNERTEQP